MLTHRERRSRQAVAVTAMALAMGFLSVADAYAQTRRGSGFSAQPQTRRPFTVTPKAPRIDVPKAPIGAAARQRVPVPVKRPARSKVVKTVGERTTVRKTQPHARYRYWYDGHHHGYHEPYGYRGYHRSYPYRPHYGGYGGGYAHCR
ncbi:MAG: hypothetical protein MI824_07810 [Hyphomicrobiales bacterium]|nr:hypothetical protein [Hyphomicrobiales bacterium]